MNISSSFYLVFSALIACKNHKGESSKREDTHKVVVADITLHPRPRYHLLKDVISEKDELVHWLTPVSGYPNLYFSWRRDSLIIEFNGQCQYTFPIKQNGDSLIVYWAIVEDCTHDIGVKKRFGLKNVPTVAKPFMSLTLTNDTTITPRYFYPDWVEKVNAIYHRYNYFPDKFMSSKYY